MPKSEPSTKPPKTNPYRPWAARFWQGMLLGTWARLVIRNRFRIGLMGVGLATTVTLISIFNSLLRPIQWLVYGRRIRNTKIAVAPIFIIGHWRSGTTMLHELMVLDEEHTSPTTYECFAPNHFLVSAWLITRLRFLLPAQRPMDNMAAGWDRPQEDEFALCNMGIPSPYLTMAFPNEPPQCTEYLDFQGVVASEINRWKEGLAWFLRAISCRRAKRIILKSPPHLGRIKVLLEMFPDARFVHIVRDPYSIFPSTVKLWKTLYGVQGLQVARYRGLEEYIFNCFERMYAAFEHQRELIHPSRFYEVRYEDLVRDPVGQMRNIYEQFQLEGFDDLLPKLEAYSADHRDYKTNRFELDPQLKTQIDHRWGPFMRRYGYCPEPADAMTQPQSLAPNP